MISLKKMLIAVRIFLGAIIIGALGVTLVGCSDREGAEEELKKQGFTPIEYEGVPGFFEREQGVFNDKFKVVAQNQKDTMEVIVTRKDRIFDNGKYTLRFK